MQHNFLQEEKERKKTKTSKVVNFSSLLLCFVFLLSISTVQAFNFNGKDVRIIYPLEENGGIPINVQDQTTRPFDIRVNQILDNSSYALAQSPIVDSYVLTLNTVVGLSPGDNIAFLEQNGMPQLLFGEIESITGNNITLNNRVPWTFIPANTSVFTFSNDLTVDGSVTEQIFEICNFFEEDVDVVRIIFNCRSSSGMDDSTFCGEPELDRGILVRKLKSDKNYINYFNVKSNGQWIDLAFDGRNSDRAPAGEFGFGTRLTYGGQSKHGVVIRLKPTECIQVLIQDDLTGLTYGSLMVEGHFIQN